jgi:hypothetical protein
MRLVDVIRTYKEAAIILAAGAATITAMILAGPAADRAVSLPNPPYTGAPDVATTTSEIPPTTTTRGIPTTTTTIAGEIPEVFPQTPSPTTTNNPPEIPPPITTLSIPTTITTTAPMPTTTTNPVPPPTHKCANNNEHCKAPPVPPGQDKPKPIHP